MTPPRLMGRHTAEGHSARDRLLFIDRSHIDVIFHDVLGAHCLSLSAKEKSTRFPKCHNTLYRTVSNTTHSQLSSLLHFVLMLRLFACQDLVVKVSKKLLYTSCATRYCDGVGSHNQSFA
jgi:hypothetical protein